MNFATDAKSNTRLAVRAIVTATVATVATIALSAGLVGARPDAAWIYGWPGVTDSCGVEVAYGLRTAGVDVCTQNIFASDGDVVTWSAR